MAKKMKLTPAGMRHLQEALERGDYPKVNRPAVTIDYQTGSYTNLQLIIEPDAEGYLQVGFRQNVRVEKLIRSFFDFDW